MALSENLALPKTITAVAGVVAIASAAAGTSDHLGYSSFGADVRASISEAMSTQAPDAMFAGTIYDRWSGQLATSKDLCAHNVPGESNLFDHVARSDDELDELADRFSGEVHTKTLCNTETGIIDESILRISYGPFINRTGCLYLGKSDERGLNWSCNSLFGEQIEYSTPLMDFAPPIASTVEHR